MAQTQKKIVYPAPADSFRGSFDLQDMANSIGSVFAVANVTERDALKQYASKTNPITVVRGDTGALEWCNGGAWVATAGPSMTVDQLGIVPLPASAITILGSKKIEAAPAGLYLAIAGFYAYAVGITACNARIGINAALAYQGRNDLSATGVLQTHAHLFNHAGGDLTVDMALQMATVPGTCGGSGTRLSVARLG